MAPETDVQQLEPAPEVSLVSAVCDLFDLLVREKRVAVLCSSTVQLAQCALFPPFHFLGHATFLFRGGGRLFR